MINPPLDELLKKVDSKYTLVVVAAKRARQLMQGEEPKIHVKSGKMVTVALHEIDQGLVEFERTKVGIK
jgi:DNA-directed RNA polymerase subunit omega